MSRGLFNAGRFSSTFGPAECEDLNNASYEARIARIQEAPEQSRFTLYGYTFEKRAAHVMPSTLEGWRQRGDPIADNALRVLLQQPAAGRVDLLERLRGLTDPAAAAFWQHAETVPSWVDFERVGRGQRVFAANAASAGICLLNLSLIGGFGAQRINRVLLGTGYLSGGGGGSRDVAHRRLLETLCMVMDCLPVYGALGDFSGPAAAAGRRILGPGGSGWESVLRVRLLHARVRHRLLTHGPVGGGAGSLWNTARDGVPVNQEDLLVTQMAFSVVVLMGMERAGLAWHLSDADMEDYLHMWRWIGYLSGVEEGLNKGMDQLKHAQIMLESVVSHIAQPDDSGRQLALSCIRAVSYRYPLLWSPVTHAAVTHALAGEAYAQSLGVPAVDDPELLLPIVDEQLSTALQGEEQYVVTAAMAKTGGAKPVGLLRRLLRWVVLCVGELLKFVLHPLLRSEDKAHPGNRALAPLRVVPYLHYYLPVLTPWLAAAQTSNMRMMLQSRLGHAHDYQPPDKY